MPKFRELKPEEWIDELDAGLEYRRRYGLETYWGELEATYYNVHPQMANDGPNIIMSTGDSMLSSVTVPDLKVVVKPEQAEAVDKTPFVESLDNKLIRELNLKEEGGRATLHAFLFGVGILKVGYDSEFGYDPRLDVGGALRLGFTFTQLNRTGTRRIENDSMVVPGMPWVRAVPPHDIILPYGCLDISSAPWIAHRICRQIDDLQADPKYSNTQRVVPTLSMESFMDSYKSQIKLPRSKIGRDAEYVEMYEIMDRRTGRIKVLTGEHPTFLRNDVNALQIENRLPYTSIKFTPTTRTFWTTPDAYYLRYAQAELSDIAVQRTKQRRIASLKFAADEDMIDDPEIEKAISPDVGVVFKVKSGGDLSKAIQPFNVPSASQGLILEEEHIRQNVREQIGFSRNQLGEFQGGRKTASEVREVASASALRMSRRGLAIRKLYSETMQIINGMVFEFWKTPRFIEVMGQQNTQEWVQRSGPQLKSRYSYEIVFTDDQEVKQRKLEALQFYLMAKQDPSINPQALQQYLVNQYNDPEFARLFDAPVSDVMRKLQIQAGMVQSQNGEQPGGSSNGLAGLLQSRNDQAGF